MFEKYDDDDDSNDGIRFTISDVTGITLSDNTFDKVLFEVIEHVPSGTEHKALQEITGVLKPGGTLALSLPVTSCQLCDGPSVLA